MGTPGKATDADIEALRERIDVIDQQLLELLSVRAGLATRVGRCKPAGGSYRSAREGMLLQRVLQANPGPLSELQVHQVFREIISVCRALQQVPRVACLGPAGTFSHVAVLERFGNAVDLVLQEDIAGVFRAVEGGSYGLVPIENSFGGSVHPTLELLEHSSLSICGESELRVRHCLLGSTLDAVHTVAAHPQALLQCRRWLDRHLPGVRRVAAESTAAAAVQLRSADDTGLVAISNTIAARLHELQVLAYGIEDDSRNVTRFIVLGRSAEAPTGNDKTSVLFTISNQPGTLYRALACFAERGVSMLRIESRPSRRGPWEYLFFVDLAGHAAVAPLQDALQDLATRVVSLKVLGAYPRSVVQLDPWHSD